MIPPLISVILPIYNAGLFVNESIQSILNQTFIDFELILINDGSTDNSEEIILAFQDERIRYYKNATNLKLIDTLNLGLELAQGKYVARIDADDIANPERFQIQVDFLEANPTYGIVGSFARKFGDSNDLLSYVEEDENIRYAFLTHNPFIHSTVMLRSSILKKYNLYFQNNRMHVEDYDLWMRLLQFSKGKILSQELIRYRLHAGQISTIYAKLQNENTRKLQEAYCFSLGFSELESELIIKLLSKQEEKIDKLVFAFSNANYLSLKLPFITLQSSFFNLIQKSVKDLILNKTSLSIVDLFYLIRIFTFFTTKQQIGILKKIVFPLKEKI